MVTRRQANAGLISTAVMAGAGALHAQETKVRDLPPARQAGGKPLIEALQLRRSIREYVDRPLPPQVLSDLLWAAFGINRSATGDRTAPYWRHIMVIDVYAAMADGVWFYDPKQHRLEQRSFAQAHAEWCSWPLHWPQEQSIPMSGFWTLASPSASERPCPIMRGF